MSYTEHSGATRRPGDKLPPKGKAAAAGAKPDPGDGAEPAAKGSTRPHRSAGAPRPGTAKAGARTGGGKPPAGKGRPAGKGGKGRVAPVRVAESRNWTAIGIFSLVALIALGLIGYAVWQNQKGGQSGGTWQDKAAAISGIKNYRKTDSAKLSRNHVEGTVNYFTTPPVGGNHNAVWTQCMGNVYTAQVPNENAVHSLEHGAVWVTYDPSRLSASQVATLASKVQGGQYVFMSQYPGQGSAISLQAWGYQLKVDSVTDPRIDQFITDLKVNASMESGAECTGGTTATGTTPVNTPGAGMTK